MELQRVMLVEDEQDIQFIARMALEQVGGMDVLVCSSGPEALASAPDFRPQLILLDVMMPGMDGPTTLSSLRALPELAETPVVFMTAKVQPQEAKRYKDLGAVGVIAKPFEPMKLAESVRDLWSASLPACV